MKNDKSFEVNRKLDEEILMEKKKIVWQAR